jgi:hypothetical protein
VHNHVAGLDVVLVDGDGLAGGGDQAGLGRKLAKLDLQSIKGARRR